MENAIYDPEVFNALIREDYSRKIQEAKDDMERQTSQVNAYYQSKSDSIEQAAANTDRQYLNEGAAAKIKLTPLGSDLHVHNYESDDEASGQSVPLVAEPGELGTAKNVVKVKVAVPATK